MMESFFSKKEGKRKKVKNMTMYLNNGIQKCWQICSNTMRVEIESQLRMRVKAHSPFKRSV